MALATPLSAALADLFAGRPAPSFGSLSAIAFGLAMPFVRGRDVSGVFVFLALALGAMGLTFALLGGLGGAFSGPRPLYRRGERL